MLRCSIRVLSQREIRMSFHEPAPLRTPLTAVDPDRVMKLGVGLAAAPLWATYLTAASAGMAYWWMTAWTRREPTSFAPALRIPTFEPAPAARERPAQAAAAEPAPAAAREAAPAQTAPEPTIPAEPFATEVSELAAEAVRAVEAAAETMAAAAPVAAGLETPVEPSRTAKAAGLAPAKPEAAVAKEPAKEAVAHKPPVRRGTPPKKR
jgi:hypothetical protein